MSMESTTTEAELHAALEAAVRILGVVSNSEGYYYGDIKDHLIVYKAARSAGIGNTPIVEEHIELLSRYIAEGKG